MAFADAVFDGALALEGVAARLADNSHTLKEIMDRRAEIPVVTWNFENLLAQLSPDVLVDARMRKRENPEVQLGLAPLTMVLLQFSGELFAHSRPAISNWTGLW